MSGQFKPYFVKLCSIGLFGFVAILLFSQSAFSYYADVIFDVDAYGVVRVSGTMNSPYLVELQNVSQTSSLTSKQKEIWTINISDYAIYDNLIYEVILPKNSIISYVDSSVKARIHIRDGHPVIVGLGDSDILRVVIQYEVFIPAQEQLNPLWFFVWLVGIILLALLIFYGGYTILHKRLRKNPYAQTEHIHPKATHIDFRGLTDRQEEIVKFIIEKGSATQTEIADALKLPKAAVSRNVHTLENRRIVKILTRGMSNVVVLEDPIEPVSDGKFVR
jgi:hypothetical protein